MDIISWMYVSKSLVPEERYDVVLDEIVDVALQRNERLRVTGCLISGRMRFAQMIEGPLDSVAELRKSIEADDRHTEVTTIDALQIGRRRFSGWSLAYAGRSSFVARTMEDTIGSSIFEEKRAANRLLLMMEEFASKS